MMRTSLLVLMLLGVCGPAGALAQKDQGDGEYGIFQTQEEYHRFMGSVKRSAAGNPQMEGMVELINDVVLGRPIGSTNKKFGGNGSTLGLLSDPKVRAELEMVDGQYEELQKLNAEIQRRAAEQLRGIDFENSKNLMQQIQRIREQADNELSSVLLPHQTKRLRQIQSQSQLRRRSLAELLTSPPLRFELQISDRQKEELLQAEQELEAELAAKIAELRSEARDKLIQRLNRTQQRQVDEIFGEAFEFLDRNNKRAAQRKK